MRKKIIVISISVLIMMLGAFFYSQNSDSAELDTESELTIQNSVNIDIVMPTKSSRPGCEETNQCYIPPEIIVKTGDSVTWQNQDAAFHSVTSGFYGDQNDLFDSGHLDPDQIFAVKFEEEGTFDYFCTLHPWMMGKVIVEG